MALASQSAGSGPRRALIVHGILGSGRNWRTISRKLASALPEWHFITVDLRNHGDSHGFGGPHDLRACAADLASLQPELIVGHSFGGKVALASLRDHGVPEVWVLDALPGPLAGPSDVEEVIRALREVPLPLARREDLARHLPLSPSLVAWMTTNLRSTPEGLVWRFDLDAVQEMMRSYWETDFWPLVESTTASVTFVRALRNERWTPAVLERFEALPPWSPVRLLELDAGHWLHADDPEGLVALLVDGLS